MQKVSIQNGYSQYKGLDGLLIRSCCKVLNNRFFKTNGDILEYDKKIYCIGHGTHQLDLDKTTTEDTKIMILNTLCHYMQGTNKENFDIVLSSPPLVYEHQRTTLPMYLKGTYDVVWNLKYPKKITINKVAVLPETFVSFFPNNKDGHLNNVQLLIWDIGGCTTNIVRIKSGTFSVDDFISQPYHGAFNLDLRVSQHITSQNPFITVNPDDMEFYRNNGLHVQQGETNYLEAEKEGITDIYCEFIDEIIKWCKDKGWDCNTHSILVTGGGGKILYPTIKELYYKNAELSSDPIFDNLNGMVDLQEEVLESEGW